MDDTNIESAVVQISGNYAGVQDVLAFTNQNGITGNLVGNTLTLTGSATLAQYETALRSITYNNTSDSPSTLVRTISFTVNDGDANSNTLTRHLSFAGVNDAPVGIADLFVTNEDAVLIANVLANDFDNDLIDTLSIILNRDVVNGQLTLQADGSFTFTPQLNYFGSDEFTYQVFDGIAYSNETTVALVVNSVNDTPIASGDSLQMFAGETAFVSIANGLLANDFDVESDPLSAILITGPNQGDLTLNADGSWRYVAAPGFFGQVSFTYAASDGSATSSPATVTILVSVGGVIPSPPTSTPPPIPVPPSLPEPTPAPIPVPEPTPSPQPTPEPTPEAPPSLEPQPETGPVPLAAASLENSNAKDRSITLENANLLEVFGSFIGTSGLELFTAKVQTIDLQIKPWTSYSQRIILQAEFSEESIGLNFIIDNSDLEFSLSQFQAHDAEHQGTFQFASGTATTLFVGASAGVAVWCVGGSYLVSLIASSLPAWANFDVIHIVNNPTRIRKEDDTSVAQIVGEGLRSEEVPRS